MEGRTILIFPCVLIASVSSMPQLISLGAKQVTFDRFDGTCPGGSAPIIYELEGTRVEGVKLWMNTTFTVKEDIAGDAKVIFHVNKCKSKENLDSCEPFHNYKSNKYCAMLESGGSLWGSYFDSFTPRYKCPLKKGVYRGINGMFDLSAMMIISTGDWYWRVAGEIRQKRTDRLIMCLFIDAYVASRPLDQTNAKGRYGPDCTSNFVSCGVSAEYNKSAL